MKHTATAHEGVQQDIGTLSTSMPRGSFEGSARLDSLWLGVQIFKLEFASGTAWRFDLTAQFQLVLKHSQGVIACPHDAKKRQEIG